MLSAMTEYLPMTPKPVVVDPLQIGMAADGNYLYPFGVALSSAARFADRPLALKIALPIDWHSMLTREQLDLMLELAHSLDMEAESIQCPLEAGDLPQTLHISSMAFIKPALLDSLPNDGKIVWLDTDTLIIKPWCHVTEYIVDNALAAAREVNTEFESRWGTDQSRNWYFNSGVMVVDLTKWHADFANSWRPLLDTYADNGFVWLDQDVFNALIKSNSDELPSEFNLLVLKNPEIHNAAILHFAGWWKPWMRTNRQMKLLDAPVRQAFDLYADAETYFFDVVQQNLGTQGLRTWEKTRSRTRGALGLKAQKHYLKGSLRKSR